MLLAKSHSATELFSSESFRTGCGKSRGAGSGLGRLGRELETYEPSHVRVAERTGISRDGRVRHIGPFQGEWQVCPKELVNDLTRRGRQGYRCRPGHRHPGTAVMIDIDPYIEHDEQRRSCPVAVGWLSPGRWRLSKSWGSMGGHLAKSGYEKTKAVRQAILVPCRNILSQQLQAQSQCQLRADRIAVRAYMTFRIATRFARLIAAAIS